MFWVHMLDFGVCPTQCLYPEDTPDGVIPQTFVTPAPPIVVPLRGREARGEPTIARDVSADRGVRLHDGSRLRVTRVNIFLSEDGGNTAKDAAAPESVAAVGVNASALGQQQENGCGIVDAAAAASTTATAAQNKACELRDVLARVATAEACIAQHASEDEARLLEVSEDVTIRQADARILGTQQPQASCAGVLLCSCAPVLLCGVILTPPLILWIHPCIPGDVVTSIQKAL